MNTLLIICLIVILFYGAQLYLRQKSLIFKPTNKIIGSPSDFRIAFEEQYLSTHNGLRVHSWWIPGSNDSKAIVFFHGNIGNLTYELKTIHFIHSLGVSLLAIDYPGYGKSEGQPNEDACYYAADSAWDFICQIKGFHGKNVILYGQSLGSALATYLASKWQCAGLVFQSGSMSIPDMAAHLYPFLPVKLFCHTKLNSYKLISKCKCPVLIIHSKSDELIPIRQAYKVYSRASTPKKFVQLNVSHYSDEWRKDLLVRKYWSELINGQIEQWEHS